MKAYYNHKFVIILIISYLLITIYSENDNQNQKKVKKEFKSKTKKTTSNDTNINPNSPNHKIKDTIKRTKNDEDLIYAAATGNINELNKALRAGANVNTYDPRAGNSPLLWASFHGYLSIVEVLLQQPMIDIEYRSKDGYKTALLMATYNGHVEIIQALILKGANMNVQNSRGDTILHIASYRGYHHIIESLLNYDSIKQLINHQTEKTGYTSLHFACYQGHMHIMELLLEHGANINILDGRNANVLMISILKQHLDILKWLIREYPMININAQDNDGNTALHIAIKETCFECVYTLILEGQALLEITNHLLQTPLILAIKIGNFEMIKLLMMYGANINVKNQDGLTCIEYANSLEYYDIRDLLQSLEVIIN